MAADRPRRRGLRGWYDDWDSHSKAYYRKGLNNTRIYRENLDQGYSPKGIWQRLKFDAEALALSGMWAASRDQRRARTLEYYRNQPQYAGAADDEIWLREQRRRSGNIILTTAGVVGAIATVALLRKYGHFDLNWSNRSEMWNNDPIVPHINMQHDSVLPDIEPSFMDGDGPSAPNWWPEGLFGWGGPKQVEFIPGHLPGQHVTPIPVPNNVDPDKWVHDHLMHHPKNPNAGGAPGTGGNAPGGGAAPGGNAPGGGSGGNAPGAGGAAPNPTGNGAEIDVEPGSGIVREIEQYRAATGHHDPVVRAFQLYQEGRHDFGDQGIINGDPTYVVQNGSPGGDLRLSRAGMAFLTNQMQQLLDQAA
jgi:hypothetical protein